MKRLLLVLGVALILPMQSCTSLNAILGEPSEAEVVAALSRLLDSSALGAVSKLMNSTDGIIPAEIRPVLGALETLGVGGDIGNIERKITDVSKTVAAESGSILKESISNLSFGDAVAVVLGGKDAATRVLKQAMYTTVKDRYSAKLDAELAKVGDIQEYWALGAGAYNMFAKNKIGGDASDFLAERAVDALFASMGAEEEKARNNYESIGSSVVNKVFDYYTKKNAY